MGRISQAVYAEIEKQLRNGISVKRVASNLSVGENTVKKVADSLYETGPDEEAPADSETEVQEEPEEAKDSKVEFWKKKSEFWKQKYLETWADLVELGE